MQAIARAVLRAKHYEIMKRYGIRAICVFAIFILVNTLSFRNNLANDGLLEIGFPWVFYRDCHGKMFDYQLDLGFFYGAFFLDLLLTSFVCIIVSFIIKKGDAL